MPQARIMGDDRDHVASIVPQLLQLIADHGLKYGLAAGDATQLTHRGGGGRVVFDITNVDQVRDRYGKRTNGASSDQVVVERVDSPPVRRPRSTTPRRALPPGGDQ